MCKDKNALKLSTTISTVTIDTDIFNEKEQ